MPDAKIVHKAATRDSYIYRMSYKGGRRIDRYDFFCGEFGFSFENLLLRTQLIFAPY